MNKKWIVVCLISVVMFCLSPMASYAKSLAVMSVYSQANEKNSLLADKAIQVNIPSGSGWYPFVMTYNADREFAAFIGEKDKRLTIMYNFPEFDLNKGCSKIYDPASPYYSSFYGAYAVSGSYGFDENKEFQPEVISRVPEFDLKKLVLEDLGMDGDVTFDWDINIIEENVTYAGYDGWIRVEADIRVNGLLHEKDEYLQNYIQYGTPNYDLNGRRDFEPVNMAGRVYTRYFKEEDITICFYIIAGGLATVDECDEKILGKSTISSMD